MAIRTYRPTTKSRRSMTNSTFEDITKSTPEKSLLAPKKNTGGRNNQGKITCRHIGGGNKVRYRIIDFRRRKDDIPATVKAIEYDPNRNANIALICYADGAKAYILEPQNLHVGDKVVSGEATDIKIGNCCDLKNIPEGTFVHNVELQPGKGGQMCRAAGTSAQVLGSEGKYVTLRLASGEVRKVLARQSRQEEMDERSSDRPRLRDEPLRPPPRRRRGQMPCRPRCSSHPLGQESPRRQDPPFEEEFQPPHHQESWQVNERRSRTTCLVPAKKDRSWMPTL